MAMGPRRTRRRAGRAVALVSALLALVRGAPPAGAHDVPTLGYSRITAEASSVVWTLYFDPYQLDTFLSLDADGDGEVTAAEVDARGDVLGGMVAPDVAATNPESGERPAGVVGDVGLVAFSSTGLHSEGFADLGDFPLVAVPVRFTFERFDVEAVELSYGLFTIDGFGDHINIVEVDIDGSQVFQFDPGITRVLIGDAIAGNAPTDAPDGAPDGAPAVAGPEATAGGGGTNVLPIALGFGVLVLGVGFAAFLLVSPRHASRVLPAPGTRTREGRRGR